MKKQLKFTTVALSKNQYLLLSKATDLFTLLPEIHCIGFTDNIRDKQLDGYYYKQDLLPYTKFW